MIGLRAELAQRSRLLVLALCGASLCILLLACANLASLLLALARCTRTRAGGAGRAGGGRERLVRQLVTESVGLALVGGIVGVVLAVASAPVLAQLVPDTIPIAEQPSVDLRVLVVATVLVLLTGLAFGVGPAVGAGRSKALDALRDNARAGGGRIGVFARGSWSSRWPRRYPARLVCLLLGRPAHSGDRSRSSDRVLTLRTALPSPRYDMTARRDQF